MLIIGEIWHYAGDFLEGDEWDTVMNYPFYLNLIDLLADEKINVSQFIQNLGYLKGRLNKKCYPLMWNLIDSMIQQDFYIYVRIIRKSSIWQQLFNCYYRECP